MSGSEIRVEEASWKNDGRPEVTIWFEQPNGSKQSLKIELSVVVDCDAAPEELRELLRIEVEKAADVWLRDLMMEFVDLLQDGVVSVRAT